MRIKKIILKDLFAFNGISEIELDKLNVIVAENGYGKTSLLNSLKLAFGKEFKIEKILNKNSDDKICFIEIYLDEFILKRSWDFNENLESLEIIKNDEVLKNYEAEEFLKEIFPLELVDFIFFDGEIEKDFILETPNKLKKIFNYIFDLDVILNLSIDTKKVANTISNNIGNKEIKEYKEKQNELDNLEITLLELETKKTSIQKEIKNLQKEIKTLNFKIKSRSKTLMSIEKELQKLKEEIEFLVNIFMKINMYQLPLILNENLQSVIQEEKIVDILDKSKFEIKIDSLIDELNLNISKEKFLQNFYKLYTSQKIELEYTKKELKELLKKISNLLLDKQILDNKYEDYKNSLQNSDLKSLLEKSNLLQNKLSNKEVELEEINSKIDQTLILKNNLLSEIRKNFLENREKYSKVKAISSLYNISYKAKELYLNKLDEKLTYFNSLLSKNSQKFLDKYKFKNIKISNKFQIMIDDFDIENFSSGQKQLLSFILIKSFLDVKHFIDFIFVDTPFGRLSNENRDFIFYDYYLSFKNLTLLVTSSEFDYINSKNISYKKYQIIKEKGSKIC